MRKKLFIILPLILLSLLLVGCRRNTDIKEPPSIVLTGDAGFFEITYKLDIVDEDDILVLLNLEIYKTNELIDTISDFEIKTFKNLTPNTEYVIRLNYQFDINDGMGTKSLTKDITIRTKKVEIPEINVEYMEVSTNLINFVLEVKNNEFIEEIKAIQLYENGVLIQTIDNLSNLQFINLTPNTNYQIVINYTYDLKDGSGIIEEVYESVIQTIGYKEPDVEIVEITIKTNSIAFELEITDLDEVFVETTKIELYKGNELVISLDDLTNLSFTDLLVDTLYEVHVTYKYKISSTLTETKTIIKEIKTAEKGLPTISVTNIKVTHNSIKFDLNINDEDYTGEIKEIILYKDGEVEQVLYDYENLQFNYLDSSTLYVLEIVYEYEADNETLEEVKYTKEIETNPKPIDVYSITLLNSTVPKVGQEIHLRIEYDNVDELNVNSIFINEEEISIYKKEENNSIVVKYIPDFDGGIYDIEITGFTYLSNNKVIAQEIEDMNINEILIIEKLNIVDVYDYYEAGFLEEGVNNYLFIEIENENDYDVIGISLNIDGKVVTYDSNDITRYSKELILIPYEEVTFSAPNNQVNFETKFTITSMTYGVYGEGYVSNKYDVSEKLFIVRSASVRNIYYIEELQNLESGYIYNIASNIYGDNFIWEPYEFSGIIYGNDMEITKISYTVDNESETKEVAGLFSNFQGLVKDLTISNMYLSIKTKGVVEVGGLASSFSGIIDNVKVIDSSIFVQNSDDVYVGGLASINSGIIKNSTVESTNIEVINDKNNANLYIGSLTGTTLTNSTSDIYNSSSKNNTITTTNIGILNIGGLTARANNIKESSVTNFNLEVTSANQVKMGTIAGVVVNSLEESYVEDINIDISSYMLVIYGGLVGEASKGDTEAVINNSYVKTLNVDIKGSTNTTVFYGGISAEAGLVNSVYVYNNNLKITGEGTYVIGGIIGVSLAKSSIENSFIINSEYKIYNEKPTHVKGLVGSGDERITNTYIKDDFTVTLNDVPYTFTLPLVEVKDLEDKLYYKDTLNWDEKIWDLSDLKLKEHKLPILK